VRQLIYNALAKPEIPSASENSPVGAHRRIQSEYNRFIVARAIAMGAASFRRQDRIKLKGTRARPSIARRSTESTQKVAVLRFSACVNFADMIGQRSRERSVLFDPMTILSRAMFRTSRSDILCVSSVGDRQCPEAVVGRYSTQTRQSGRLYRHKEEAEA
jgi:hypothetical protein